jgi:hypothetical protein
VAAHFSTTVAAHFSTAVAAHFSTAVAAHFSTAVAAHFSTAVAAHFSTAVAAHFSTAVAAHFSTAALRISSFAFLTHRVVNLLTSIFFSFSVASFTLTTYSNQPTAAAHTRGGLAPESDKTRLPGKRRPRPLTDVSKLPVFPSLACSYIS